MNEYVKRIHHVGYLVKDMAKSIDAFRVLGFVLQYDAVYDTERDAEIAFVSSGRAVIELVAPSAGSEIYPLLKKYKNTPYHICYEVNELEKAVGYLEAQGFMLFKPPAKAPAISPEAAVVFLMHSGIGLVELCQVR